MLLRAIWAVVFFFSCGLVALAQNPAVEPTDAQRQQIRMEQIQVEHFTFDLSNRFSSKIFSSYLGLVEDQKLRMEDVKRSFDAEKRLIVSAVGLTNTEKLKRLVEMRVQHDEQLRGVLLPHQTGKEHSFTTYTMIRKEGFSNSLINGVIATSLGLSTGERRSLKDKSELARKTYEQSLVAAQKKYLASLREALPQDKNTMLSELLEPMMTHDGVFWTSSSHHLDSQDSKLTYVIPKLPSLDKK